MLVRQTAPYLAPGVLTLGALGTAPASRRHRRGLGAAASTVAADSGDVSLVRPTRSGRNVSVTAGQPECELANPPAGKHWVHVGPGACDYQLVADTPAPSSTTSSTTTATGSGYNPAPIVAQQDLPSGAFYYTYADGSKVLIYPSSAAPGYVTPPPATSTGLVYDPTTGMYVPPATAAAAPATGFDITTVPWWGWALVGLGAYALLRRR